MRNLVFVALALGGLSQATGCVFSSSSGGPSGQFNAAWMLTAALNGSTAGCAAAGADSVTVVSQPADGGASFKDVFNCSDLSGTTSPLPLGDYQVWVEADSGNTMIAQSDTVMTSLVADGDLVDLDPFSFPWDAGYLGLTWDINGQMPDASTCSGVGANDVKIAATIATPDMTEYDDLFTCSDGQGTSSALPLGDYSVTVSIRDGSSPPQVLGTSMTHSASLTYGNDFEDLGNFAFVF